MGTERFIAIGVLPVKLSTYQFNGLCCKLDKIAHIYIHVPDITLG